MEAAQKSGKPEEAMAAAMTGLGAALVEVGRTRGDRPIGSRWCRRLRGFAEKTTVPRRPARWVS